MDKDKIIMFLWGCVTVSLIGLYVASTVLETIKVFKTSNGAEIAIEPGSLVQLAMVIAAYYLTKWLIYKDNDNKEIEKD